MMEELRTTIQQNMFGFKMEMTMDHHHLRMQCIWTDQMEMAYMSQEEFVTYWNNENPDAPI